MPQSTHRKTPRLLPCASTALLVSCAMDSGAPSELSDDTSPKPVVVQLTKSATSAAGCSTRFLPLGTPFEGFGLCNTFAVVIPWGPLQEEDFVIGTACDLNHSWQTTDGVWHPWQSLGGCLVDRPGPIPPNSIKNLGWTNFRKAPRSLTIVGIGTDQDYWCRDWPWTNRWYPCLREIDVHLGTELTE